MTPEGARAISIGLAAVATAACAHAPGKITFAEAGLEAPPAVEPEGGSRPPSAPAPGQVAGARPAGPPVDGLLLAFAAEARSRRARSAPGRGFPAEASLAWAGLARDLDGYLERNIAQTPLLELLRARVTVEAELEFDGRRYGQPPEDVRVALGQRLGRLASRARAARALGERLGQSFLPLLRWPLEGAGLSSPFGMRLHPLDGLRRMHWGIDLAAAPGRAVGAAAPGIVVHAGWTAGYGLLVEVRHAGELASRYSHLSHLLCRIGDAVEVGQPLGLVGRTGAATGPHLHFEVWKGGRARDPLAWLGGPVGGGAD